MLKLPEIFKDGCVIEKNARIWGDTDAGQAVTVRFRGQEYETKADAGGRFDIRFDAGAPGGPFTLEINDCVINDVCVGYVWFCGGQSNMEMPVSRVRRAFKDELDNASYPLIRAYAVENRRGFSDEDEKAKTRWLKTEGKALDDFYATAYFFGKELYDRYNVPIGLICCAAGGSAAESWLSPDALSRFPEYLAEYKKWQPPGLSFKTEEDEYADIDKWHKTLDKNDPGLPGGWHQPDFDDSAWDERGITEPWDTDLHINGSVWFRKTADIPADIADKPCDIYLGVVVDSDYIYVNGTFVGRIEYRYPPSIFPLPKGVLRPGKNTIAVRALSHNGVGGFVRDKEYKIKSGSSEVSLAGGWKYRVGAVMPPCPVPTPFYTKPGAFWHSMFKPVSGYPISGAIWYQGETNAGRSEDYKTIMETLIAEWRGIWGYDFPFICVSLANYAENSAPYPRSYWAELREKQAECLGIPNTAMASAIDCGEYNDIHPLDKKTVGQRLALAARALAYNENIVYKNPLAAQAGYENGKITITFKDTGGGLVIKNAKPLLEIETTDDGVFTVSARLDGDKIIADFEEMWLPRVRYVRYAWADCPAVWLYNKEGLPACGFRLKLID